MIENRQRDTLFLHTTWYIWCYRTNMEHINHTIFVGTYWYGIYVSKSEEKILECAPVLAY